jgi:BMFP domain-containing protein YqiC
MDGRELAEEVRDHIRRGAAEVVLPRGLAEQVEQELRRAAAWWDEKTDMVEVLRVRRCLLARTSESREYYRLRVQELEAEVTALKSQLAATAPVPPPVRRGG